MASPSSKLSQHITVDLQGRADYFDVNALPDPKDQAT